MQQQSNNTEDSEKKKDVKHKTSDKNDKEGKTDDDASSSSTEQEDDDDCYSSSSEEEEPQENVDGYAKPVVQLDKGELSNNDRQKSSVKPKKIRFAHVWSPYVVWGKQNETEDPFYPLDQAQNVTWASMWRAKEFYEERHPGGSINIYCAILWTDLEVLQRHEPPLCTKDNTLVLERSTQTEYPHIQPAIHYPFVNDMLRLTSIAEEGNLTRGDTRKDSSSHYIIYTNSDIGVIKYFYTTLENAMMKKITDHKAFQINRRSIAKEYRPLRGRSEPRMLTSNDLDLIDSVIRKNYTYHPGVDCFVMRKDILDGIDLGNLFVGQPPWAGVLKKILKDFMTTNYGEYSSRAGLTYHLGDDRDWNRGGQNLTGTKKLERVKPCFFPNYPKDGIFNEHRYQNTLNCALISNGTEEFMEHDGPFPPFMNVHAYDRAVSVQKVKRRERQKEKIKRAEMVKQRQQEKQKKKQAEKKKSQGGLGGKGKPL
ncbi:MAG: hypothetical protein SGILL_002114 [Bacillariaceae sp.]